MKRGVTKKILTHYQEHGRHDLPWRKTVDPYRIMVSEIMLQQTQVDRVIPKYKNFLKRFPSLRSLARASLGDVLREWQGLGYNRRGKMLYEAARAIQSCHGGCVPCGRHDLEALPGIGHYTAGAIRAFAFDESDDFVETNIRTVLIHEFFPGERSVSDQKLLAFLSELRGKHSPRLFYSALMDYGAHLKGQGVSLNARSSQYAKQKPFAGSGREVRGAIVRALAESKPVKSLPFDKVRIDEALTQLLREKMIVKHRNTFRLP